MSRHRKPDDVEPDEIDFDALMAKPLWSAEDAARFLDMPLASLYKWRTMGEAPAAFRMGRHLRSSPPTCSPGWKLGATTRCVVPCRRRGPYPPGWGKPGPIGTGEVELRKALAKRRLDFAHRLSVPGDSHRYWRLDLAR